MHLDLRHLRAIKAIHESGGLARAADILNITQSALSHQVKALEEQVGMELFVRRTKPLKLSAAGQRLLRLADKVLPEILATEEEFRNLQSGRAGRLFITMECHACFEWLLPVLESFRKVWPDVDVDIRTGMAFDAIPALEREEVDLVISSDPDDLPNVQFQPLFDYSPVFVAAANHRLKDRPFVVATDFLEENLITYPVDRARLDVFTTLLGPAKVEPRSHRRVELTGVILILVAAGRGVSVMPDWVVREMRNTSDFITKPLTETGVAKRMYAGIRREDSAKPYLAHFIRLARTEPVKLQRGEA